MPGGNPQPIGELTPGEQAVRKQLDRITGSAEFLTSKRSSDFLRFVVTRVLEGRENEISQHSLAAEVFGRGEEFDPTTDPIVRIQAGRVRRSLKSYYLTEGTNDPVLIELPKGSYVAVFVHNPAAEPAIPSAVPQEPWPTLLVTPLSNLTGSPEADFIAEGLASDLAAEFSRDKALHVFLSPHPEVESRPACPARFELAGTVALRENDYKINLHLVDTDSTRQTWANTFFCPKGTDQGTALDQLVQETVSTVAEEHGILSTHLNAEGRHKPFTAGSAYEAILRHHHLERTRDPQAFVETLAALRQAVEADPDCALCWSYLGRLSGTQWSLGLPGEHILIEDSLAAARRGADLAPQDVRCRAVLGYILLIMDKLEPARAEAETALTLCGKSVFWLDAIGYLLTLLGDWDRGPALIRQALEINPFPRRSVYGALWLDALRRDDPAETLAMAREYAPESYFWTPVMEAVALVGLDRLDEAASCVEALVQLKPDFPKRARWFITRYVKSDELVGRIEDSLRSAGLPDSVRSKR